MEKTIKMWIIWIIGNNPLTHNTLSPGQSLDLNNDLHELTRLMKEINQIKNITKMLKAVKELRINLETSKTPLDKFQGSTNFAENFIICLKTKIGELIEFLNRFQMYIAMINEAKCMTKDKLQIRNYTCVRKERENSAGGVAVFIRNSIPHKAVKQCDSITLECACIRLPSDIYFVAAYNNPRNEFKTKEISNLLNIRNRVLIFVDLNARHKTWKFT